MSQADSPSRLLDDLLERELLYQWTDLDAIRRLLAEPQAVYCGFDPSADSLHIGNLLPLLVLRRLQLAGHRPIAVLGGGTGLIGDPSGKSEERRLNPREVVAEWTEKIRRQIGAILELDGPNPAIVVNNYDWLASLSVIDYLRDLGKHFPVGGMLAKESVRSRMAGGEGLSYTEFSYMILQAYDFLHLYRTHGCRLQIGGSDQWGNMTAGIDLIRRAEGAEAHAATFPLLTTADGKKFGKSEGNAVWLDPDRTSPYAFYQFWLNTDDRDVIRFLRYFTLLPPAEIAAVAEKHRERPERREAHSLLAWEVTRLVHGPEQATRARQASEVLFGRGEVQALDPEALAMVLETIPTVQVPAQGELPPLHTLLVQGGLCRSASEARRAVQSGGVYVNGERVLDPEFRAEGGHFLHGTAMLVRRGKKSHLAVQCRTE